MRNDVIYVYMGAAMLCALYEAAIRQQSHSMNSVVLCRPRWDKCGRYVEGGEERWLELANNRGSDELVDVLLAEMTGTDIAIIQAGASTGDEFFEGQVSVPCAFLSPGIKV